MLVARLLAALALTHFIAGPAHAAIDDLTRAVGDTILVDTLTARPGAEPSSPLSTPAIPAAGVTASSAAATPHVETMLPFAQNEIPHVYPRVSMAFGIAAYSLRSAGVEDAFASIEYAYSAAGFPLPPAAEPSPGAMMLATLTVWLNKSVDLACQLGRAEGENGELRLLGGIVSSRFTLPEARNVSLQAGLGGGTSGFKFIKHYGVPVTPVDPSGGWVELTSVELKGAAAYWTTQGGVTIQLGSHTAFNALIQYVGAGDVSTTTARAGTVSVNVSGTMIGASFVFFY